MKYKYDLQIHSSLSDGDYAVVDVIKIAKKNGLKGISITDHNTWKKFDLKNKLAKRYKIENINGIEISTKFSDVEIHILGYAKNFDVSILKNGLKETIHGYNDRMALIIKKLKAANIISLDIKKIKAKKGNDLAVTKYDLAKAISSSLNIPIKDASKFVNHGGVGFVPYGNWAMSPIAAIKLIHKARGIAILAHPGESHNKLIKKFGSIKGKKIFYQLLFNLIKNDLDGLEIYTTKNEPAIKNSCLKLCKKFNLIATGGSDWHGEKHHPELKMGTGGLNQSYYKRFIESL